MLETAAPGDRPSLLRQIHATEQQEDAVRDRVRLEVAGLAAPIATVEPTPDSVAAVAPAVRQAADRWESANKYGDPIEEQIAGISVRKALEIAAEDPSLIWVQTNTFFIAPANEPANEHAAGYDGNQFALNTNPSEWTVSQRNS